jgi:hypothetical protein
MARCQIVELLRTCQSASSCKQCILAQNMRYSLRLPRRVLLVAIPVLMTACDPGISVRQITSRGQSTVGKVAPENSVALDVKTTRQLIGQAWYDPEIRVTNLTSFPITIENIELATTSKIYAKSTARPETSPFEIQPGSTETIHVSFRLDDAVYRVFKQPAELRVHYQHGGMEEIARASVVGGSRRQAD